MRRLRQLRQRAGDAVLRAWVTVTAALVPVVGFAWADSDTNKLPVFRWLSSTNNLHGRISWTDAEQLMGAVSRVTLESWLMALTQAIWGGTIGLMKFAITSDGFNPTQSNANAIDSSAKSIASTVLGSVLIVLAVLAVLLSAFWKKRKGQSASSAWRRIGFIAGVTTILAVFATSSTLTPTKVVNDISTVAQTAVGSISIGLEPNNDGGQASMSTYFIKNMHDDYINTGGNAQLLEVSKLWEQSGLQAYKQVQFGYNNPIADNVYAPWLDIISRQDYGQTLSYAGFSGDNVKWTSAAMMNNGLDLGDSTKEDQAIFAWAECASDNGAQSWYIRGFFTAANGSSYDPKAQGPDGDTCWQMFNNGDPKYDNKFDRNNTSDDVKGWLKSVGGPDEVDGNGTSNRVKANWITDFGNSVHGRNAAVGTMSVAVALIGALVDFIVFGLMFSGVIIFFKVMIMIMTAVLVFAMVVSIFSRQGPDMMARYGKQFLGYQFIVALASGLLGAVLWLASLVTNVVNGFVGGMGASVVTTFFQMMMPIFSPVIAIVGLHMIFTKLLKMPSPMSLSGAKAWAGMGAAAPAAVGSGIGSWLGSKAAHGAKQAGSAAASKVTGGRVGTTPGGGKNTDPRAASKLGEKPAVAPVSKRDGKRLKKAGLDPDEAAAALAFQKQNGGAPLSAGQKARKAMAGSNTSKALSGVRAKAGHPLNTLDSRLSDRRRFLSGTGPTVQQRLKALAGDDDARMAVESGRSERRLAKEQLKQFRQGQDHPIREGLSGVGDDVKGVFGAAKDKVVSVGRSVVQNPWQSAGRAAAIGGASLFLGPIAGAAVAGGVLTKAAVGHRRGARVENARSAVKTYREHLGEQQGRQAEE